MKRVFLAIALIMLAAGCVQQTPKLGEPGAEIVSVTPEPPAAPPEPPMAPPEAPPEMPVIPLEPGPLIPPEPEAPVPASFSLDVPVQYSGFSGMPGLCYLGAFAMLANYEAGYSFTDTVAYSGVGSSAFVVSLPQGKVLTSPYAETSIISAAKSLGLEFGLGVLKGGRASAPYPPLFDKEAASVESFADADAAMAFLEKTIAGNHPVEIHLDPYYIAEELAESSPGAWQHMIGEHTSHFMAVAGYDEANYYLNDPTAEEKAKALPVTKANFMEAWEHGKDVEMGLGPYWMLYVSGESSPKAAHEIAAFNKGQAANAASVISGFAETGSKSEPACFLLNEMACARHHLSLWLASNGEQEAAALYEGSSGALASACDGNFKSSLSSAAGYEEEAVF